MNRLLRNRKPRKDNYASNQPDERFSKERKSSLSLKFNGWLRNRKGQWRKPHLPPKIILFSAVLLLLFIVVYTFRYIIQQTIRTRYTYKSKPIGTYTANTTHKFPTSLDMRRLNLAIFSPVSIIGHLICHPLMFE